MMLRSGLIALALTVPVAAARAAPVMNEAGMIKVPARSTLVGTVALDEIRTIPELKGRSKASRVVEVEGVDRVLQTVKSYNATVSFFDQQFKQDGYQVMARVETPSAMAWTIQRPDGTIANAVVRNTRPTTFELIEVAAPTVQPTP